MAVDCFGASSLLFVIAVLPHHRSSSFVRGRRYSGRLQAHAGPQPRRFSGLVVAATAASALFRLGLPLPGVPPPQQGGIFGNNAVTMRWGLKPLNCNLLCRAEGNNTFQHRRTLVAVAGRGTWSTGKWRDEQQAEEEYKGEEDGHRRPRMAVAAAKGDGAAVGQSSRSPQFTLLHAYALRPRWGWAALAGAIIRLTPLAPPLHRTLVVDTKVSHSYMKSAAGTKLHRVAHGGAK